MAQSWFDDGGPGFNVVGMPHRTVVDGEFLISRVTVIKTVTSRTCLHIHGFKLPLPATC